MKQTINFNEFNQAFIDYSRTENFSYEGRKALFEYLEELEDDCGIEIELDVIALCCDYCEDTLENIASDYKVSIEGVLDYLNNNTTVIPVTEDIVIYQAF